jgi:hypothetical protein
MDELFEVKLLNYTFRFKRLTWREEFLIKFPKGKDQTRVYLSHALKEVSGLSVETIEEATRILEALPSAISSRVFRIYKGQIQPNQRFETAALYKAPEPNKFRVLLQDDETEKDELAERARIRLEQQFGHREVAAATAVDLQILKASKLRGAIKASPENVS